MKSSTKRLLQDSKTATEAQITKIEALILSETEHLEMLPRESDKALETKVFIDNLNGLLAVLEEVEETLSDLIQDE